MAKNRSEQQTESEGMSPREHEGIRTPLLTFFKDDQLVRGGSQISGIEMGVSLAGGVGTF